MLAKYRSLALALLLVTVLGSWLGRSSMTAQPTPPAPVGKTAQWKAVQEAQQKGLPKDAIAALSPIIDRATETGDHAEAVKAISQRVILEGVIQGNKAEEKITRMEAEIAKAAPEIEPYLQAVLANWYWHYFQQNRWRFMQRTDIQATGVGEASSDDFTQWSLPRILREIDRQFDKTFADADVLKQAATTDYADIVDFTDQAIEFRPTMFDIIAHNALEFYSTGEQAGNRKTDAFDLSANGPIFDDADDFLAWKPETTDEDSLKLRAVELLQDLLRFHAADDDPAARLDADLARLTFGNNHAFGDDKTDRYKASLKRLAQSNPEHAVAARARHDLAEIIHGEGDWVLAHQICNDVIESYPNSVGASRCHNLIEQIEQKQCSITTERNWTSPWPTIDVDYRNVDRVFFRLVRFDDVAAILQGRPGATHIDNNDFDGLIDRRPDRAWSADLPPTADYKERTESVKVPADVKPGAFYLLSSHKEDFNVDDNVLSLTEVYVTNLALITRDEANGKASGFVLDADSGDPVAGATVQGWGYPKRSLNPPRIRRRGTPGVPQNNQPKMVALPTVRTDQNGRYEIPAADHDNVVIQASHDGHSVNSLRGDRYNSRTDNESEYERTTLFTDRSIYRPGQTIRYKGIVYEVRHADDHYQVMGNRGVFVSFQDPNGKQIERKFHETNDYGSFEGSFTAPRDRLTGQMQIKIAAGPSGAATIRVEEYKRPKFQVELEPPKQAVKLDANVVMTGKATGYTGASINDAKVSYRVVRSVRYPVWWYWRCWWMPPQNNSQEIAHGTTTTSSGGTFEIEFTAEPDAAIDRASEPTFQYQVFVDVTDTTGETRSSSRTIRVGYTSLTATLSAPSWLTAEADVDLTIRTATLDGEGQSATGQVTVHRLIQPEQVARPSISGRSRQPIPSGGKVNVDDPPAVEPANPNSWRLGDVAWQADFKTDAAGNQTLPVDLDAGIYRAVLKTRDAFDNEVTAILPMEVIDTDAEQLNIRVPEIFKTESTTVQPGDTFTAIWGSGYDKARVFVEVEHRGKVLQSFWSDPEVTQVKITQAVTEAMRGGFTVRTTMVRENRGYLRTLTVNVPWTNKDLSVEWERFTNKLKPGEKETWSAIIRGPEAKAAAAEMVATLYDASLDAYMPHNWMSSFNVFRRDRSFVRMTFQNTTSQLRAYRHDWTNDYRNGDLVYPRLAGELTQNFMGYQYARMSRGRGTNEMFFGAAPMAAPTAAAMEMADGAETDQMGRAMALGDTADGLAAGATAKQGKVSGTPTDKSADQPDLETVSIRKNLNETAFFFPRLIAGEDGSVRMEFTMPEALTEWKFIGFAHDTHLRSGPLTDTIVTSKDLMVQPNAPRFVREGDQIEFTVKISNLSPTRQTGTVRLNLSSARTGDSVDDRIGNAHRDQSFQVAAGESKTYRWRLSIPDSIGFMTYKAVASTGKLSDGEQGFLPVLSRRVLVTESLALPIRGKQTKDFRFDKLAESARSETLQHQSLTVQMVSNPSWYAVMALPYLMEFPHECSEQLFNRVYANALARKIVTSDPKIERIFQQWRGTPALDSPLMQNQDLKAVMLEETPWLRQAESESEARRNVGVLFDQNRLGDELSTALAKLADQQLGDGSWPWFPGGRGNDYITLYVTTGFGRLNHLGVEIDTAPAIRSLSRLDGWVTKMYDDIKVSDRRKNHLSTTIALYLYGRSFFLDEHPVAPEHSEAVNYYVSQAQEYWLELSHRQSQAHLAIALKRFDKVAAARGIMESIRQRSVSDEELGMYWRDTELSWWWYRAPIETQAMMIEAFDEVMDDADAVEDCKVWLLKQKQTQDWKTTKATADAVYALLLRGSDNLASDDLVSVALGGQVIKPDDVEAGTGFYQQRFAGSDVNASLADVKVTKVDEGVAWGSVHWQYLEDIAAVTTHQATPLALTKQLYVKKNTDDGKKLIRVDTAAGDTVNVGDELVVRIVLASDRDMEYLHMKDHRGSGTEPVNVLSRYRFQDGLAYYESTKDTATHFFIDYLPKGKYVFEYSTRVQLRGEYQTGLANIQCMYAPEFNSHSESLPIVVK